MITLTRGIPAPSKASPRVQRPPARGGRGKCNVHLLWAGGASAPGLVLHHAASWSARGRGKTVELEHLEHHTQIVIAYLAAAALGLEQPLEHDHEGKRRVEVVGERIAEGFHVVAHVRWTGLVGHKFLQRLTDAQRVLGAGRQARERVAEWQRGVGAEQVERNRRAGEMFERVAQQDALAGAGGLDLNAVAARAKANIDPLV